MGSFRACRSEALSPSFWLSALEFLERRAQAAEGIVFEREWQRSVVDMMELRILARADKPKADKALAAFGSAISKARGEIKNCDTSDILRMAGSTLPANDMAALTGREEILSKALGPDLYMLRQSCVESKKVALALSESVAAALSGRPARPRLWLASPF